jgi:hypothetical protein
MANRKRATASEREGGKGLVGLYLRRSARLEGCRPPRATGRSIY